MYRNIFRRITAEKISAVSEGEKTVTDFSSSKLLSKKRYY